MSQVKIHVASQQKIDQKTYLHRSQINFTLSIQQVFLSATFPPSMKVEFREMQVTLGYEHGRIVQGLMTKKLYSCAVPRPTRNIYQC